MPWGKIKEWFDGGLAGQAVAPVVYDTGVKTPEQWRAFGEMGGIIGDNGNMLIGDKSIGTLNPMTTPDAGKFLGIDKGTWGGIGSAVGVGKGLFDIFSGIQQGRLAKDYYKQQMGLQKEQAAMAREEANRIKTDRSRLNSGYGGE